MKNFKITAMIHGSKITDIVEAISKEEAVGKFLIENFTNCYDHIKNIEEIKMPDMRQKIEEYIKDLAEEIVKLEQWCEDNFNCDADKVSKVEGRLIALSEVKNDLKNRLEELID